MIRQEGRETTSQMAIWKIHRIIFSRYFFSHTACNGTWITTIEQSGIESRNIYNNLHWLNLCIKTHCTKLIWQATLHSNINLDQLFNSTMSDQGKIRKWWSSFKVPTEKISYQQLCPTDYNSTKIKFRHHIFNRLIAAWNCVMLLT